MRIALSNLAWPEDDHATLSALAEAGLNGVEVALTRLAPWEAQSDALLDAYRDRLTDLGLEIPSLQAVLFGIDGVALLEDEAAFERMLDHLRLVAARGSRLGARIAVFGSPRQRSRGALSETEAFDLGARRFARAARMMADQGMALGLEPVPAHYGGDFLPRAQDVLAMVRAVDHPGLRLHLDTGCVLLGGDDIGEAVRAGGAELAHFHAAEPDLAGFDAPQADHVAAARALKATGYAGWVSIEMRQAPEAWDQATMTALAYVRDVYGRGGS